MPWLNDDMSPNIIQKLDRATTSEVSSKNEKPAQFTGTRATLNKH